MVGCPALGMRWDVWGMCLGNFDRPCSTRQGDVGSVQFSQWSEGYRREEHLLKPVEVRRETPFFWVGYIWNNVSSRYKTRGLNEDIPGSTIKRV